MPTMNVSLTPELEAFVQVMIGTGRYQSASEVMREALRLLMDAEDAKRLRWLRDADAEANRGGPSLTLEEVEILLGNGGKSAKRRPAARR